VCAKRLRTVADLSQYTSANAARDLDDVRAALGVDKWSLFGASYGTRLALVYMRMFPDHVRRAALLGVLPPEAPTGRDFARGGQQALDSAFAACAREDACRRRSPDPRHDVVALLERLRRSPASVTLRSGGETEQVSLTARAAAEALFIAAYYPPQLMHMLSLVHDAVTTGDLREITTQFAELSRSKRTARAVGLRLSVWCAEDIPRLNATDTLSSRSLLGIPALPEIIAACAEWPHALIPASYGARVASSVPTLLNVRRTRSGDAGVSGGLGCEGTRHSERTTTRQPVMPRWTREPATAWLAFSTRREVVGSLIALRVVPIVLRRECSGTRIVLPLCQREHDGHRPRTRGARTCDRDRRR
jgi:pimeloyl-ACP methyl ester carboxylesterase